LGTKALTALLLIGALTGVASARTLRVCADPNNLPFSNRAGEGYENALARVLAKALSAQLEYMWLPQRRGFVRNTLSAQRCDVMMEAPVGFQRAATTRPYFRSSYVFVTRKGDQLDLRSLDDPRLEQLRIGVQVIGDDYANTPPAAALARRGLAANVRGYSVYGDYGSKAPLQPIIDAVAHGDVDVALVWGPLAGYFAAQSKVPLRLEPVTPWLDDMQWPMQFDVSVGIQKDNQKLLKQVDRILSRRNGDIQRLLASYHVPVVNE